ncbi:FkbM family methyltransferase [Telluribacter sp. SYSU D00476]|uniref:FkbM family methyltransferase n=1 Tax=Telluribacter sp. SYSU D00476 TaxID=2811430 RepID=UPI001FF582B1|nr:FkbM family methyltransferase [Telluribacter sp. SYSU D00476]
MKSVVLPNGLSVQAFNRLEPQVLYHEIFATEAYAKHGIVVHPGDCVFDVGANLGLFSIYLAQHYPDLTIYSIEPVPAMFELLRHNAARHVAPAATSHLLNIGLSNASRTATFAYNRILSMTAGMYSKELEAGVDRQATAYAWVQAMVADAARAGQLNARAARGLNRLLATPGLRLPVLVLLSVPLLLLLGYLKRSTRQVACQLRTLSEVLHEQQVARVDLVKIDVEGGEWDVLRGVHDDDWPRLRQLVIEVHDLHNRVADMTGFLQTRGYEVIVDQEDWSLHRLMRIHTLYARRVD